MIPLLFSCVNIGDELSAAAVTRGLGGTVKRSSVVDLKLTVKDILMMALFLSATILFIAVKYIR
jgi:energy-coupling factor transport system permease protein